MFAKNGGTKNNAFWSALSVYPVSGRGTLSYFHSGRCTYATYHRCLSSCSKGLPSSSGPRQVDAFGGRIIKSVRLVVISNSAIAANDYLEPYRSLGSNGRRSAKELVEWHRTVGIATGTTSRTPKKEPPAHGKRRKKCGLHRL